MDIRARYDAMADRYEDAVGDDVTDPATAALLELTGEVDGLRLLELACGHGRIARELARRGAHVIGIDIAAGLLDKARAREDEAPLGIRYELADAAAPGTLHGELFDCVVCNYGLSDLDDLDGALATVARLLRAGGWFAFSILHPCFPGWVSAEAPSSWQPGTGYFAEGWWQATTPGFRGTVGANHRTRSTYVNALARHGLTVERLVEPAFPAEWAAAAPGADPVPVFLAALSRRRGGPAPRGSS
jgi:ubiquinone/menaquinone biosynthesis C-methylase UbiE